MEAGAKDSTEAFGSPSSAGSARLLRRQALHELPDVGEHGNEGPLRRGRGSWTRAKRGGQVPAELVGPGGPGEPRSEDGSACGQEADHREHEEGRNPRLRGAPIDVAHVVDQGQPADGGAAVVDDGQHAHVNGAADQMEHSRAAGGSAAGDHGVALQVLRERLGRRGRLLPGTAYGSSEEAFVPDELLEKRHGPGPLVAAQAGGQSLPRASEDDLGPHREVALRPAMRLRVHERRRPQRDDREEDEQGDDESKRGSHELHLQR